MTFPITLFNQLFFDNILRNKLHILGILYQNNWKSIYIIRKNLKCQNKSNQRQHYFIEIPENCRNSHHFVQITIIGSGGLFPQIRFQVRIGKHSLCQWNATLPSNSLPQSIWKALMVKNRLSFSEWLDQESKKRHVKVTGMSWYDLTLL